ncbi:hypothetical protein CLI92_08605 [Vandammella animalimorsus]|uniref:Yip1 domain-containing protein n=1 Tax=Vandammella animalimorsus TaxID=2029117 RepID=A0A2A2AV65_9BURK|nr:YIP1 family protein [Vandammella animalimorsus]PAT31408.1 hypothetical protein CK626_10455 [Vandammella animalimorsus]PAT42480.1 hypothetical protein CK621_09085 [Vandammella animalimorsus]PAX16399.1 hypothetical protein CLI92_08605 [Vandammella animalimorsus]PAX18814.1 hypothetical protein CLI93_10685 [Vandammella animalimorsus]
MSQTSPAPLFSLQRMAQLALYVIVRPAEYFRTMPRQGPLAEPMLFVMVMAIAAALLASLPLLLLHGQAPALLDILVLTPGLSLGAVFIASAIVMLLWKALGSPHGYQVAFRCVAATMALAPVTALLAFVPYVGAVLNIAWTMYLWTIASVEVHGISQRKAAVAFTLLGLLMAGGIWQMQSMQAQILAERLEPLGITLEQFEAMSPQEQNRVLQQILQVPPGGAGGATSGPAAQ